MKITDYHRHVVTQYYMRLVNSYGLPAFKRRVKSLKRIVWTRIDLVEQHL
jgi:hypothetical protein